MDAGGGGGDGTRNVVATHSVCGIVVNTNYFRSILSLVHDGMAADNERYVMKVVVDHLKQSIAASPENGCEFVSRAKVIHVKCISTKS